MAQPYMPGEQDDLAKMDLGQLENTIDEKHTTHQIPHHTPTGQSPISYLYLTFESSLPTAPTSKEAGLSDTQHLPSCPDLKSYVSPLTWPAARKNLLVALSCSATFLTAYSAGTYSPPSAAMAKDLHTGHLPVLVGITTFCLGFAIAPMALAPLSEIWGRYPVFVFAGFVYLVFQAVCSVMTNLAGMLVARFLVGVGGSVFSSVVGGVLADLYTNEERNTSMAIFSGCVMFGTGAGPLVAAAFVAGLDGTQAWKWSFWHQVILDGILLIAIVVLFRESRGSVLLTRKAKKLNEWYEQLEDVGAYGLWVRDSDMEARTNPDSSSSTLQPDSIEVRYISDREQRPDVQLRRIRWVVLADEQRPPLGEMITTSIKRPFYLMCTEPVVFFFSLWAAFAWAILYLSFAVVPFLYANNFEKSSRVYVAIMASAVIATAVGIAQERLLKHPLWRNKAPDGVKRPNTGFWAFMRRKFPAESPESRLYFTCVTALLLPLGLFGAFLGPSSSSDYSIAIGIGFANWGIYSIYLATFNYLADTYHIYASSALAAQGFCRNILGGVFPVITGLIFQDLGLKPAGGMLGGIACALTVIPWVLVFFGERIRARSNFAVVSLS